MHPLINRNYATSLINDIASNAAPTVFYFTSPFCFSLRNPKSAIQ